MKLVRDWTPSRRVWTVRKRIQSRVFSLAHKDAEDLAVEKKSLAKDTQYLGDKKRGDQQRATQFEDVSRDAKAELTAFGKAKGTLAQKFSAMLQAKIVAQAATMTKCKGACLAPR